MSEAVRDLEGASGVIGTSQLRVEDFGLLVGGGQFTANEAPDDALVVHFVTSVVAHAKVRVDVEAVRSSPGIHDVLVAADLEKQAMPDITTGTWKPQYEERDKPVPGTSRPVLARDRVRYVGEPLVAIVGESYEAVLDAAELADIEYDPLPAVVGPEQALEDEVLLFPDSGTNLLAETKGGASHPFDLDDCEVVVEGRFVNQRLAACPIEPRAAASMWTDDGRLVHWSSCQGIHPIRTAILNYYDLAPNQVRVITRDVGGSFGSKARITSEQLLLPLLAKRTRRPVCWTPARSLDMLGLGHSRAQIQHVRVGGAPDGTIEAMDVLVLADAGAYSEIVPAMTRSTCSLLPGPLALRSVRWTLKAAVTNATPIVAYRGAGRPEAAALVDRAVDLFAAEVGLDPLEVRKKNLLASEQLPWENPSGVVYDSGDYHEALSMLESELGYGELREEQARRRHRGRPDLLGIGLTVFVDRTAGVPGSEYGAVELLPDGKIRVITGSTPYGQGHQTSWAMLVAEQTGLPLSQITVEHGDTDVVPRGGLTGGSKSVQKAGSAVALATGDLVARAREVAADLLEAAPGDIVLDTAAAAFHVRGAPAAGRLGWADIAARWPQENSLPRCEADFAGEGPTIPYGAYGAVVEVDRDTGRTELLRLVAIDDAGTILNRMIAEGQVHGGVAQGVAQALFEEFAYDPDGNPLTASLADYAVPAASELPSIETLLTEHPSPNNPLGFKGIGESGAVGAVPAVQNAVIDAVAHLGVRHIDLPLTPERVWRAINQSVIPT
ncbi:MAG: xanthine dehydrogenase family protein molybdopterin-binding subunit [bacterium]|nr:xanthine dehydrogenase family protein molybdopterin-binding subunit [bacterium]